MDLARLLKIGAASQALLLILIVLDLPSSVTPLSFSHARASRRPIMAAFVGAGGGCKVALNERRSNEGVPAYSAARATAFPRLSMAASIRSRIRASVVGPTCSASTSSSPRGAGLLGLEDMRRFTEANGVAAEYVRIERRPDAEIAALTAKATAGIAEDVIVISLQMHRFIHR